MEKPFYIRVIRTKKENIRFFLGGVSLKINNMFLCPEYIQNQLKPLKFVYKYDIFDTFETGYFIKENIRVEINWNIYTDYDFEIDKYSTYEEIDLVKVWVEKIFQFLIENEDVEKQYFDSKNKIDEIIHLIERPEKNIISKIKNYLNL